MDNILDDLNFKGVITTYEEFEAIVDTSYEYDSYIILLTTGTYFYHDDKRYDNYDVAYFYNEEWDTITNVLNDDYTFKFQEKYLSILTTRFFGGDLTANYPKFVQFCKEYLGQCDDGFWKFASKISSYGNIDEMPDDILTLALSQYAIHFAFYAQEIPYFYDETNEVWLHDNIRHFLRLNKQFNLTKGSPQSLFFLFEMFEGKLVLRLLYKQLVKVSDYKPIIKIGTDGMIEIDGYEESSYISCRDNDTKDSLYHLHGQDDRTGIKWAYYTAILKTDLDIDKYQDIVESIIKPAGVQYFWEQMAPQSVSGVEGEPDYINIENTSAVCLTIDDITFPTNYTGILLGRDLVYDATIDTFEVPAFTTYMILYKYIGNESDWTETEINVYSDSVLHTKVEIG